LLRSSPRWRSPGRETASSSSLLVAALLFGSVLADAPKSKNAEVTLVYHSELPTAPMERIEGVLVGYGASGYPPPAEEANCGRPPEGGNDGSNTPDIGERRRLK
jgi:hypothetical protein